MTTARLSLTLALGACCAVAHGQTLSPAPAPGLWESDWKMRVNGQDMGAAMREMQEQMLQQVPPAQRAQMAAMMGSPGGPMPGGKHRECLTAADAARATRPDEALAEMRRNAPQCRFDSPQVDGSTLRFKGRCEDPGGFTGDVNGELVMDSAKAWHGRFGGQGRMAHASEMPGIKAGPGGTIDMRMEGGSRWVAASCGDLKPTPR